MSNPSTVKLPLDLVKNQTQHVRLNIVNGSLVVEAISNGAWVVIATLAVLP